MHANATWKADPPVLAAGLVTIAGIPINQLRSWFCPCCGECKVVFAQDGRGNVWVAMVESFLREDRHVFQLEARGEVDDLPGRLRHLEDRVLLVRWYRAGLYDELARLFAS